MCIAIYKPASKSISKKRLQQCYNSNPDGAGFMYAENKQLHIHKGYFNFDKFYKDFKEHKNKKCVIHFRIKTHGKIDKTNCHPFNINDSLGFVHNGIISGFGNNTHSDTIQFNEKILQKLVGKWGNLALFEDPIVDLIEGRIGWSKLIMLDRHNNHKIFNEEKGEWNGGVWYSNTSYKPKLISKNTTYQSNFDYDKWWTQGIGNRLTHTPPTVSSAQTFKEGDLCVVTDLIHDHSTNTSIDVGEYVEVVKSNSDGTVDVITETDNTYAPFVYYNVNPRKLVSCDNYEV